MNERLAIGVGARSGVDADELVMLVKRVAAQLIAQSARPHPHRSPEETWRPPLFTIDTKRDEPGLHEAARLLNTTIFFLPLEALLARKDDVLTRSARVEALMGIGSVAEAAALAGAGRASVLLGPRIATDRLTCAIARNALDEAP
ncbi:MAG: cobalamin biosynthesis protein CbiG [Methylocystaceae bacterium]|nr:MAG: cobalamin biosynthesis protein CbiG [Methylocystaceae bacterium]